jgi:hypothetical protein
MSKKLTKEEALAKIEELKKYVADEEQATKKVKIQIKSYMGLVLFESEKTTIKEAVRDAVLRDADLSGAVLRDADLSGAVLSGAYLSGAVLRDADLSGAVLRDADLSGAVLSGAVLSGAVLRGTELQNARFYGKGGNTRINKNQLDDFLKALGVVVND